MGNSCGCAKTCCQAQLLEKNPSAITLNYPSFGSSKNLEKVKYCKEYPVVVGHKLTRADLVYHPDMNPYTEAALDAILSSSDLLSIETDLTFIKKKPIKLKDGSTYQGTTNTAGQMHGFGEMIYPNGAGYKGDWTMGIIHGKGRLVLPGGNIYIGDFEAGQPYGSGHYFKEGLVYHGEIKAGLPHGRGKEIFPDGTTYKGWFSQNKWNGKGKLTFPDGSLFIGYFEDGLAIGPGIVPLN